VSKQELGRVGVDVRYAVPGPSPIPAAARAESVDVRVPSEIGGCGVDSSDHPRADVAGGGLGDELADRLPCRTAELAEQLAAMKKIGSQKLG